jgi:hypothetical protein
MFDGNETWNRRLPRINADGERWNAKFTKRRITPVGRVGNPPCVNAFSPRMDPQSLQAGCVPRMVQFKLPGR